eukprot:6511297-Prymnesium_polylepis.1
MALTTLRDRAAGALAGLQQSFAAVRLRRAACSRGAGLWGNYTRSERDDYRNWRNKISGRA